MGLRGVELGVSSFGVMEGAEFIEGFGVPG